MTVGASSGVELGACSASLNVHDFRSNPEDDMSPCTATGVGRMNASAARNPATSPSRLLELMGSSVTVFLSVLGVTLRLSADA